MPEKHDLNAPIVTVLGAGVAGLTAAHELVERGFIVQVVEAAEDPDQPGRPHIGGMAANQHARVRANVEDLHPDLIREAMQAEPLPHVKVARWLLEVFAFNRTRWIQSERPHRINGSIFSMPEDEAAASFKKSLFASLAAARQRYRLRWLWDLTVRVAEVRAAQLEGADPRVQEQAEKERPGAVEAACLVFEQLQSMSSADILWHILDSQLKGEANFPENLARLPTLDELKACLEKVAVPALEREFLAFRIVAHAAPGFPDAMRDALALADAWTTLFEADPRLSPCCLSKPARVRHAPVQVTKGTESLGITAWVELEVIEQRLPGEHGYRFFPSFYRHLDDTMARIPIIEHGRETHRTVFDNLRPTVFQGIGLGKQDRKKLNLDPAQDKPGKKAAPTVVELRRKRPRSIEELRDQTDRFVRRLGGTPKDSVLLTAKLVRFMTSSHERRAAQYAEQTWDEFLDVERFSKNMRAHVTSASQALLAFSAAEADAWTYGNVAVQMLLDQLGDGNRSDRTLNGPTSDAWLEPWRHYLEAQGVRFFCAQVQKLELREGEVVPVLAPVKKSTTERNGFVAHDGTTLLTHEAPHQGMRPDFYVLALHLEETERLLRTIEEDMKGKGATLGDFKKTLEFAEQVHARKAFRVMTGVQYFFDARTNIGEGHMYFPFAPWGLSSISQSQFWAKPGGFASGYFGVLSVDVCDTDSGKPTFFEVLNESATAEAESEDEENQLVPAMTYGKLRVATRIMSAIRSRISTKDVAPAPRCFHVDRTLERKSISRKFLASVTGLDRVRPGLRDGRIRYGVAFNRWVVCGTMMATHTRMTTMEAANESARHAVNAILDALTRASHPWSGDATMPHHLDLEQGRAEIESLRNRTYNGTSVNRAFDPVTTWNPEDHEMQDLEMFRRIDRRLLALGLPHFMDILQIERKLEHAIEGLELFGKQNDELAIGKAIASMFDLSEVGVDELLKRELGDGYVARFEKAAGLREGFVAGERDRVRQRLQDLAPGE